MRTYLDLLLFLGITLLTAILVSALPEWQSPVRVALGFVVVLAAPGYALMSALVMASGVWRYPVEPTNDLHLVWQGEARQPGLKAERCAGEGVAAAVMPYVVAPDSVCVASSVRAGTLAPHGLDATPGASATARFGGLGARLGLRRGDMLRGHLVDGARGDGRGARARARLVRPRSAIDSVGPLA